MSNYTGKTTQAFIDATSNEREHILKGLRKDDRGELAHELAIVINASEIRFHPYLRTAHKRMKRFKRLYEKIQKDPGKLALRSALNAAVTRMENTLEYLEQTTDRAEAAEQQVLELQADKAQFMQTYEEQMGKISELEAEIVRFEQGSLLISRLYTMKKERSALQINLAILGFMEKVDDPEQNSED